MTRGLPAGLAHDAGDPARPLARVQRFARAHAHGAWQLAEIRGLDPASVALLARDPLLAGVDLEQAVFLDTETSGLSGGAGTWVFLVGLGRFVDGQFEVWQGFLGEPARERELLSETAQRIAAAPVLVSFFGKSFDRHRLEDKMRIHGIAPPFASRPHLDLYHPLRRLYRGAYGDMRLRTLESELCGLARTDDLSGAFAPEAWFDFLAERPHRLEGVFRHNLDDVLSLVTLCAHLGQAVRETRRDGAPLGGCAATRAANLARAFALDGDRRTALAWIERAVERHGGTDCEQRDVLVLRAELHAALGATAEALQSFLHLAQVEDHRTAHCLLAAAKLEEHALHDLDAALRSCAQAATAIERTHAGAERARLVRELQARRARIERKLSSRGDGARIRTDTEANP